MALETIPSGLLIPAVTPATPQSSLNAAPRGAQDLETDDPKLLAKKLLLRELFGVGEQDEDDSERQPRTSVPPGDTVTLSSEAIELYQRDSAKLTLKTEEGTLEVEFERVTSLRVERQQLSRGGEVKQADPLVLDLDADGIELTDVTTGQGVSFDLTGDGKAESVSWVSPSDGLLTLDRNGNGRIDDGRELFGDQHGAVDGFAELARFDADRNGRIDADDAVYERLQVWRDLNQNGQSETEELQSLQSYGIHAIGLQQTASNARIAGNTVAGYGGYSGSRSGQVGEVLLNYFA